MQVTSRPMPEWLVEPQPVEDIWSALLRGVSLNPAAIAACQEGEGELTYAKLRERSLRCAAVVSSVLGGGSALAGSRIAVMMPNDVRVIQLHFACAALECSLVNINTHVTADELLYILEDCEDCELLVAHTSYREVVRDAVGALQGTRKVRVCWVGDFANISDDDSLGQGMQDLDLDDACDCASDFESFDPSEDEGVNADAEYMVYYTSGTTGKPKRVSLTQRTVCTHAYCMMHEMEVTGGDVWGHVAPMFHLVDAFAIYTVTMCGGRHVVCPRFETSKVLETMEREGVTCVNMASTMLAILAQSPASSRVDLSSMRVISCGGSPIAPATQKKVFAVFGCKFFVSYGMTETCGKISMSILNQEDKDQVRSPARTTPQRARDDCKFVFFSNAATLSAPGMQVRGRGGGPRPRCHLRQALLRH